MKITVLLKPNSKHREEVEESNGGITIYTKQPATEGKANLAAIKLLANHYSVSKSQVELIQGHTSKRKVFKIDK